MFASLLVQLVWLKVVGGLYLIYLAYKALFGHSEGGSNGMNVKIGWLSPLWSTIVAIEIMDLVFSIDNAAVLAAMVKELPKNQQKKALTYGIAGAYLFR